MAGTHPFVTQLRTVLETLNDEALASLANRGLVRRAQKDLEAARPGILGIEADRARVQLADAVVDVLAIVSKSTCSCPATGVCRHILAALVFLRDDTDWGREEASTAKEASRDVAVAPDLTGLASSRAPEVAPVAATSPSDVLGALDDDAIQQWAGKATFRKGLKALAARPQVEIETAPALVIRFPARNITCRWMPGTGLEGLICSCRAEFVCEHVVTALLAYQVSLGKRKIASEEAVLKESAGAPRSRAEVLASVATVLREIVALGLARVSEASAQRLTTLAVSAHGVDLPKLERMLKTLADELRLALKRDAQASSANLLLQTARVEALRAGLSRGFPAGLVGQHRTRYHEVGQIKLHGLGAQKWRSQGGYQGLTLYFWDESRQGWSTWSESRPLDQAGFDPAGRYEGDGPWDGCASVREAARSIVQLSGAWRNPHGRLSGRASTRAMVIAPSRPQEIPGAVSRWPELSERAKRLFSGSLGERTENLELAVLTPKVWGPPLYDSLRQELVRPVLDEDGRSVDLWLPFTEENETAVRLLEQHDACETYGLLGALRLVAGRLRVQPVSLFAGEQIVNVNLDRVSSADRGRARRGKPDDEGNSTPEDEAAIGGENEVTLPSSSTPLGRFLTTAQAEIEAIAESGIAVRHDPELLSSAAKRFDALGLSSCARPLARLLNALSSSSKLAETEARNQAAGTLLHSYYVLRLASDQETVSLACGGV